MRCFLMPSNNISAIFNIFVQFSTSSNFITTDILGYGPSKSETEVRGSCKRIRKQMA